MKKGLYVLQVLILSLLFIGCNSEDEQTSTPIVQGAKTELFAVGTTRITRAAAKPYLFTLENINSFNVQTREIVFQDFEPTSQLFPIYRNIEVHSYGKVLLHITTFVSSLSESGKFYLSDCYPRNIENDSHYAKDNKVIAESREKRATEWGEFLSILRKHGKLIE